MTKAFLLGQKQATQNALSKLLKERKYELVLWIVERLYEEHPEAFEQQGQARLTVLDVLEYLTEVMRDLPTTIVRVLQYFTKKVNFAPLFLEAVTTDGEARTEESKSERIARVLSNLIPGDVISPDIRMPLILLVANCSLFFI